MGEASEDQRCVEAKACCEALKRVRVTVVVLAVALAVASGILVLISFNYFGIEKRCNEVSSTAVYRLMLLDIYHYYGVALRDVQAAYDMLVANYYAQYLEVPYNLRWVIEGMWRKPALYLNDSLDILNSILDQIRETRWPNEFVDEVLQLQQIIYESKTLVTQMMQVVNKDIYSENDLAEARSIVEQFISYSDKIFSLATSTS